MTKESQQKEVKKEEKKTYIISQDRLNQLSARYRMMNLSGDYHDNIKNGLIWLISEEEDKKE